MQKVAPHTLPPQKRPIQPQSQENQQTATPAQMLARRIRREQGPEQAKRFLYAMEPFIAPAERMNIAKMLGIQLEYRPDNRHTGAQQNAHYPEQHYDAPVFNQSPQQQPAGDGFMGQMPQGGMNRPMQMMQMLSQMPGMAGGAGGAMNPMMLAQMFGGMMNKKG